MTEATMTTETTTDAATGMALSPATERAIHDKADVIYQAALREGDDGT